MGAGVRGSRLVVDQSQLTENLATLENRQALFTHAGHHARDPDRALDDYVEAIAGVALREDQAVGHVAPFPRVLGKQPQLLCRQTLLAQNVELGFLGDMYPIASPLFTALQLEGLRRSAKELTHLCVGGAYLFGKGLPETPQQTHGQFTVGGHDGIECYRWNGVEGSLSDSEGGGGTRHPVEERNLSKEGARIES